MAKFSIAVKDFSSKEEDKPMWIDVEAWSTVGERVLRADLTKGRELVATGRLALAEYETVDKQGTKLKVSKPVLKLTSFHLTGPNPKGREKLAV